MIELYIVYSDILLKLVKNGNNGNYEKLQKQRYEELLGFIEYDNLNIYPKTKEELKEIIGTLYEYTRLQNELYIVVFQRDTYDVSIIKDPNLVNLDICSTILKEFMY